MSLLDKASLIVTPNAYKESKLYSVVPNTTLGDMDVVRATTATRINEQGLIEVVPRNLLTYSEQIDNVAWTKENATITTNNTTAPNGTLTAELLTSTSTSFSDILQSTSQTAGNTYTLSCYAKKASSDWIFLRLTFAAAAPRVWFNLNTGTIGTITSGLTASIQDIGNGWYRCSISGTASATPPADRIDIALANADASTAPNIGNSVYIWGAQLEQGSTATTYFPTTTRLNIPRIDYTNGSCPSLLVEPQRTNLLTYSENFTNSDWNQSDLNILSNQLISPDGTLTADKLNERNENSVQWTWQYKDFNGWYTFSVFAKKAERNYISLITAIGNNTYFNLNNGTIVSVGSGVTAKIENYGNGWYKCIVTATISSSFPYMIISNSDNGSRVSYLGDSTKGIFVWGAQLEQGTYPTSYIPTVATSVTRNADVISKTGISSLIGQTEGTAFIECTADTTNPNGAMLLYLGSSDGSGAFNYSTYLKFSSTSLNLAVYSGGTSYVDSTSSQTYTNKQNIKVAIAYKNNDFVCYANGVQLFIDTTGVVSTNLSTLSLGYYPPNIPYNQYNGNIKSVQLYKTRLTNAELAQLTTL